LSAFVHPYVPDPNSLEPLPPPYEILELEPGKPVRIKVLGYKIGRMTIHPKYSAGAFEKTIVAIRIFTDEESKPTFPQYWDITPSRLVYQLAPLLANHNMIGRTIELYRDIPGPKAHYQVRIVE